MTGNASSVVLIGLSILAGAALQSATGFGFGLVVAPVAFALLKPAEAIWLITLLALLINVLTLSTEGRRPEPLVRETAWLLVWALPGALVGVAYLKSVDESLLQVTVTVAVLTSLAVRRWQPHVRIPLIPAGIAAGALNLALGTGGPPVVLYLLGHDVPPARLRDTLSVYFLVSGVLTSVVLAVTDVEPLPTLTALAASVPLVVVGHVVGRRVFRRLADGGFEAALVLVLLATAAGGLARALG
jgi:uncharacterized membrane protein YfcA